MAEPVKMPFGVGIWVGMCYTGWHWQHLANTIELMRTFVKLLLVSG